MKVLSHYTSLAGLEGIVGSNSIRAYDFLQLMDSSEVTFALESIVKKALLNFFKKIPDDLKNKDNSFEDLLVSDKTIAQQLRVEFRKTLSDTSIFVASFAKGLTADEDVRGIRTLWRLYAEENKGYCIQFSDEAIRSLVSFERERRSYEYIDLVAVKYAIDETDREYLWLCEQYELRLADWVCQRYGDARLFQIVNYEKMSANSDFEFRLVRFCSLHKDPSYRDEREVRIVACPAIQAESRAFIGVALKKKIHLDARGKRYVAIGEKIHPGLVANRVLLGAFADEQPAKNCVPFGVLIERTTMSAY